MSWPRRCRCRPGFLCNHGSQDEGGRERGGRAWSTHLRAGGVGNRARKRERQGAGRMGARVGAFMATTRCTENAPAPRSPFETTGGRGLGPQACKSLPRQSLACSKRAGCPRAGCRRPCPSARRRMRCRAAHRPAPGSFSSWDSGPASWASFCWAQTFLPPNAIFPQPA
jgi:hypothetical protein